MSTYFEAPGVALTIILPGQPGYRQPFRLSRLGNGGHHHGFCFADSEPMTDAPHYRYICTLPENHDEDHATFRAIDGAMIATWPRERKEE